MSYGALAWVRGYVCASDGWNQQTVMNAGFWSHPKGGLLKRGLVWLVKVKFSVGGGVVYFFHIGVFCVGGKCRRSVGADVGAALLLTR